jgi:hypothetical protein
MAFSASILYCIKIALADSMGLVPVLLMMMEVKKVFGRVKSRILKFCLMPLAQI